ncbi:MAG TPA: tetratricopeptide repeat protein [Lysobacter sp.]
MSGNGRRGHASMRAHRLGRACLLVLALAALPAFAQDAQLDQARQAAWAGRIGEGLRLLDQYLAAHPDDRAARVDRARFLAWRGDYAAAIATLDGLGADDDETRGLRARIHAWAGRRDTALALNAPLYAAAPDDYDNAWTQALASRLGEWPHEALPALATTIAIKPDETDTRDLARSVRLPMFSWVGAPLSWYSDSDDIEIDSYGLDASLRLSRQWRLSARAQRREYRATAGGPFAPVTGGDSVDERRIGVGARVALSPDAALGVSVLRSELDPAASGVRDRETLGRIDFSHRATDDFSWGLGYERERIGFSPRSLSLGIVRNTVAFDALWTPTLRDRISAALAFDDYNDDNRRHAALVDYRHTLLYTDRASFALGGQAEWMGYSDNPDNGYYSPDRYVRVAPLVSSYISFSQDAGLFLQAAVGAQRDETFDGWKRAVDLSAELTLGVYSRWQLVGRAGYSQRLNQFGQYEGTSVGLELRYRFCDHRPDECPAAAE